MLKIPPVCADTQRLSEHSVSTPVFSSLWLLQSKLEDDTESGEDFSASKRHSRSLMGSFSKRKVSPWQGEVCTRSWILGGFFSLHTYTYREEFHNCNICSTSLWGCLLNRQAGELLFIVHNNTDSIYMKVWGCARSNWEPQKLIYTFYLRVCASFITRLRPWAEFSPCANSAAEPSVMKAVIFHFL